MLGYLPVNVDFSGSGTVCERAESTARQINAVSGRAARAGIRNSDGDTVALTANIVTAVTGVGDEDLAATVLGRESIALPGGSKGANEVAIGVHCAARSSSIFLVVNGSEAGVANAAC